MGEGGDSAAGERAATAVGERALAGIAIALTAVAGYLDALGWILLSHVYVANMSGNTIAVGRGLAEHNLGEALARIWPIFAFGLGLFVSEVAHELLRRRGRSSSAGFTLGLEAGAVALVAILPWPPVQSATGLAYYLPTGLLALAMGLQNATLIRVGASSVYTTHVTGNLTRLVREAAHSVIWVGDRARHLTTGGLFEQRSTRRVLLMSAILVAYGTAALLGALAASAWQGRGGLAAVIALTALVIVDAFKPIGGHQPATHPNAMF
jgi:uncharacterized membrane protein YoaK (UPF0700 family)